MQSRILCPQCGHQLSVYRNPLPTVDVLILFSGQGVVLVERRNPPLGWALPGGFIDYGESAEAAAIREAREETGLDVELLDLFGVYSDPDRDPRHHSMSVVFLATCTDCSLLQAGDDALTVRCFPLNKRPRNMVFDHGRILDDFQARWDHLNPGIKRS
jgi:8-oxo-dGTP diphosphatase